MVASPLQRELVWVRIDSGKVISLPRDWIRLPATPSYRISRACRICRRDVYWSMVSGNPSSSSLVTDTSLANRHHPTAQRRSFPASISGAASEARGSRGNPPGPEVTHGDFYTRSWRSRTDIVAAAKCTSRAFPPRDPLFFCPARRLFLRDQSRFT